MKEQHVQGDLYARRRRVVRPARGPGAFLTVGSTSKNKRGVATPKFTIKLWIDNERPRDLPSPEDIVQICQDHDKEQANAPLTDFPKQGFPLKSKNGTEIAWVKHGRDIDLPEAMMQSYLSAKFKGDATLKVCAPAVHLAFEDGSYGYMVMELVRGVPCQCSDARLVATAVQAVIDISITSGAPGPFAKGLIRHPFYVDWKAPRPYNSVDDLQNYLNDILLRGNRTERIDFTAEVAAHGLRLCPADFNNGNFLKDESGNLIVVDFACYSFLPPTFLEHAFRCGDLFARSVREHLQLPDAMQLNELITAQKVLVPYNSNTIGPATTSAERN
ncbi:hypothetical protein NLJ89_g1490 [Agrocybe chaxingu]|uniref:Aminoglycoside phosphotransferase domain-containing protein n=1 Tax=Agrocybe chaxingu TaxID=84603 RepID=A0A9W8N003_9AGAR|nr:hypothetical protein NLJ89_g1490 [Agrocybe chaxingu]